MKIHFCFFNCRDTIVGTFSGVDVWKLLKHPHPLTFPGCSSAAELRRGSASSSADLPSRRSDRSSSSWWICCPCDRGNPSDAASSRARSPCCPQLRSPPSPCAQHPSGPRTLPHPLCWREKLEWQRCSLRLHYHYTVKHWTPYLITNGIKIEAHHQFDSLVWWEKLRL